MKAGAVIVCAGWGRRFGSRDKAIVSLAGQPLFYHALKAFCGLGAIKQIIVVVRDAHCGFAKRFVPVYLQRRYNICFLPGGRERIDSVRNGLAGLDKDIGYVLIHDGARPLVSKTLIKSILAALRKEKAVVCGLASRDTLKKIRSSGYVWKTLERTNVVSIQTPQGFKKDVLLTAYKKRKRRSAFDDSQLVEAIGVKVKVIEGDVRNFKITYPEDLQLAETILTAPSRGKGNRVL